MKQYIISKDRTFVRSEVPFIFCSPFYDDVVDRSTFSITSDSDMVRVQNLSGSSGRGVYDDENNLPDDIVVKIRSGKFDRTEVKKIQDDYIKSKRQENLKNIDDNNKAKEIEISKARQEFLDRKTGFTGQPVEN